MGFTQSQQVLTAPFNYPENGIVPFDPIPAPLVSGKLLPEIDPEQLTLMCRIILFIPFKGDINQPPISVKARPNPGPTGEFFNFELDYKGAPIRHATTFYIAYYDYQYTGLDWNLFPNQKIVITTNVFYTDPGTSRGTVTTVQAVM